MEMEIDWKCSKMADKDNFSHGNRCISRGVAVEESFSPVQHMFLCSLTEIIEGSFNTLCSFSPSFLTLFD